MFVAISSMSFLIPPTAYPARFGTLLTTLLVCIHPHLQIQIQIHHSHRLPGAGEHVHLSAVVHAVRLTGLDRPGRLDPLHHDLGLRRPAPLRRRLDQHEARHEENQQRDGEAIVGLGSNLSRGSCPLVYHISCYLHNCIGLNINFFWASELFYLCLFIVA